MRQNPPFIFLWHFAFTLHVFQSVSSFTSLRGNILSLDSTGTHLHCVAVGCPASCLTSSLFPPPPWSLDPGLPGDPGGPGPELQQFSGYSLGHHRPVGQRQHPQPRSQPHRKRPWGNLFQPAQAGQVRSSSMFSVLIGKKRLKVFSRCTSLSMKLNTALYDSCKHVFTQRV